MAIIALCYAWYTKVDANDEYLGSSSYMSKSRSILVST